MKNEKWYYRCNLETKVAENYEQIGPTWLNVTGMEELPDEVLADMSWTGNPIGFLSEAAAEELGVTGLQEVKSTALDVAKKALRDKRETLLKDTDVLVLPDRWEDYSVEKKTEIAVYRQTLRDITNTDNPFEVVWPSPLEYK